MEKDSHARMCGDYLQTGFELYTEKVAGGTRGCLGFVRDNLTGNLVPNTALNKDIREVTHRPRQVIITYRKKIVHSAYSEIVHVSKKIDWEKIIFPPPYETLPKPSKNKTNDIKNPHQSR